jgi:hypothetical protein
MLHSQCGVDIQSQTAYELALQGLIKPANSKIPLLYGIKCIHFQPPDFTIGKYFQHNLNITVSFNNVNFHVF